MFPLLITFLASLIYPSPGEAASRCLGCHQTHYAANGSCTSCHRGNDRTDRKRVAHDQLIPGKYSWSKIPDSSPVAKGQKLLDTLSCRRCHTIEQKGNMLASNLDAAATVRQPQELAESVRIPAQLMPDFKLDDDAVTGLVNAILAGTAAPKQNESPVVVHFSRAPEKLNAFDSKCGPCHRMLTNRKGSLGRGRIGPNLSGLLTPFYPRTFSQGSRWSLPQVKEWVENPRRIRKLTTMPPIALHREWEEISRLLKDAAQ